jgi:hypothetical protein
MSPSRPRIRRVPLERTRPIRNPVVSAVRPASGFASPFDAREGLSTAERLAAVSNAAVQGAVECGVKTAYTVIDEYMRRGREAASRDRGRPNWRGDMNDNRYNYNNPNMAWGPMWPFIAPWMQAMQAWTSAMSTFVPGAVPQNPWGQCATSPTVSMTVSSRFPTEVSACVDPGVDAMRLSADALSMDQADLRLFGGVVITSECGHVRISVRVPNDQPPGRYSAAIKDTAGCRRGELTVEISRLETPPSGGTA